MFSIAAAFATLAIAGMVVLGLLAPRWWRKRQLRHAAQIAFPRPYRKYLRRQWPLYQRLPVHVQQKLHQRIQQFLADKQFIGCDGLTVTEEMAVLIAAQACLLSLEQAEPMYPELRQILIYPDAFKVPTTQIDAAGVVHEQHQHRLGESWQQGQVILSWQHTWAGAKQSDDGHNLVFHEFAHQLDQLSGAANGAPPQANLALQQRWSEQMPRIYQQYCAELQRNAPQLLDAYAATNPAEFFAVATESYFERPQELKAWHPHLYRLLHDYYQLDPCQWSASPASLGAKAPS